MPKLFPHINQIGIAPLLLISALGIIAFLAIASVAPFKTLQLSQIFIKPAFAVGPDVAAGELNLSATYNSIAVELKFTGDDNRNASAGLEFKKVSDTTWHQGLPLWRVDPSDGTSPIDSHGRAFYGSALLLEPGTQYDIKVTLEDPDGGGDVLTSSTSTRHDNIPKADTLIPTHFVRTDGDDNNPGNVDSSTGAWKTLEKAVKSAPSGAIVQVGPGFYIQPKSTRTLPVTFKAKHPAVDDNRTIINAGNHTIIEPGNTSTGLTTVSCPSNAGDCPNPAFKGIWQPVTGLSAPGLPGDNVTAGTLLPEGVNASAAIWKWVNAPIADPAYLSYSSSRNAEPQRVPKWTLSRNPDLQSPEGFIEKMITNKTFNYGMGVLNSGKDLYLRLPANAPVSDPNQLYITLASPWKGAAFNLQSDNIRVTGFEIRSFDYGINVKVSSDNVIDHNLILGGRNGISLTGFEPNQYGSGHTIEYNLIKDSNMRAPSGQTASEKQLIPWDFVKASSITNADGTSYSISKPGSSSETSAISGEGGSTNTTIRFNTIDGHFNGGFGTGASDFDRYSYYNRDIHDNLIQNIADDGFEPENQAINFKAWNNTIKYAATFLSTGPVEYGPLYLFRNTAWRVGPNGVGVTENDKRNVRGRIFKYSGKSYPPGRVYVINNTFYTDQINSVTSEGVDGGAESAGGSASEEAFYLRNNLFRTSGYAFRAPNSDLGRWEEDYNYFSTSKSNSGLEFKGVTYKNVAGYEGLDLYRTAAAQGANTNKIASTDHTFLDFQFVDDNLTNPSTGDLSPKPGSPFLDSGVVVPNITQGFKGCAPDIGNSDLSSGPQCDPQPLSFGSPLEQGLIGYWKMDESQWTNDCSGTPVSDSSGNNKNGKSCPPNNGISSLSAGKFSNAADFNGSNQYIDIPNPGLPTADFTYSAWIYPDSASDEMVFMGSSGNGEDEFYLYITGNDVRIEVNNVVVINTNSDVIPASQWSLLTVTRQGSAVSFYKNGALVAGGIEGSVLNFGSCQLFIGVDSDGGCANNLGNYFDGKIDDARVYNRALSAQEVVDLYDWRPGQIGYWKMDEASWTNDCSGPSAIDSSGNQKNGLSCPASTRLTTLGSGKSGNAPDFNGSGQYLKINDLALPTGDFSYTAWVYPNTVNDEIVFMAADSGGNDGFYLYITSGGIRVEVNNAVVFTTANNIIPSSQWTHLAVTRQGNVVSLYMNGSVVATGNEGNTLNFGTCPLLIGVDADGGCTGSLGNYMNGKIDEARVFNRALSASEITELFNGNF